MLNSQFCYLAGTGRTGTHWFARLFTAACDKGQVVAFHDDFPKRAKTAGRRNPAAFFANYLLNLMLARQNMAIYVECNPALLEHVALTYGISDARAVLPAGQLAKPARGLLLVRSPFAYVASMKARGYGWNWWSYPSAGQVYGLGDGYNQRPAVERYAVAWALKNQFYHGLVDLGVQVLKFELLFDRRVTKERFAERIAGVFEVFGIEPIQGSAFWWRLRDQRVAEKNQGGVGLSSAEHETVKRICGPVMQEMGYA